MLINQLILATERSFASIGKQDLVDVRLAKPRYLASGSQPNSFGRLGAASEAKRNPRRGQGLGIF